MKRLIDFLKAKPVITGIIGIVMGFFVLRILGTGSGNSDLLSMGMLRFAVAMIETVFLILISGRKFAFHVLENKKSMGNSPCIWFI